MFQFKALFFFHVLMGFCEEITRRIYSLATDCPFPLTPHYSSDVCIESDYVDQLRTAIWISSSPIIHHEQAVICLNHIPLS